LRLGRGRNAVLAVGFVIVIAAGIWEIYLWLRPPPPARLTLAAASYDQMAGWRDDGVTAAIPAFLRSCAMFLAKPDDAPLDPKGQGVDFGKIGDWHPVCTAAAALPTGNDQLARQFFENEFVPLLAGNNDKPDGLFTGYFEIELNGSHHRHGKYQTPLYRRPPNPGQYSRAEIEDGALGEQGLELLWVDDPIGAFFLEIQGSGKIRLHKGGTLRLSYDGANGRPYVAVGRLLVERGILPREAVSMNAIRQWMLANPADGAALRRENPSYVFFCEISGDGPLGAEQVVLTPGRSLAVDRRFIALGVPIWLDAEERFNTGVHRQLVMAQDTGGAIRGPVRGDLYWGSGAVAGNGAGAMNARGRYYLLLPKRVAERLVPGVGTH
jgi:membrane-bound lytic murein transglycosylase A